jgi:MFS family permease
MTLGAGVSETTPLISSPSNVEIGPQPLPSIKNERELSKLRGILICLSIWVLIFGITGNVSLITTIQSPIAIDLDAFTEVSWFSSIYLIAITSITPIAGRLSTIFTARVYLLASIIIHACGLLITSQARTLSAFLVGRAVGGIGSAAVTPVAFILVTELTTQGRRGLFFGCINTGYTTGIACGAIIAGLLEPLIGWRAVFWAQIPFTLTAAVVAFFAIPKHDEEVKAASQRGTLFEKLSQIDYFGVITLIASVVLLLYSLSSPRIQVLPIVLSLGSLLLFIFVEANWAEYPIVPISVLRSRGNMLTSFATLGIMTARWSILFYAPTYVLTLRGWPQEKAGITLIPTNLGFALGGLLAGWLHIRRSGSFYVSVLVCFVLFVLSMFTVSWVSTPTSNMWLYLLFIFVNGFIAGCLLNYSLAHVLHLTVPSTHVIVIPLNAMFRSLSGSFGAAISGGLFLRTLQHALKHEFKERGLSGKGPLIRQLIGTPRLVQNLEGVDREVALLGYETAFRTMFMAGGCLTIIVLLLQAGTGWTAPEVVKDEEGSTGVRRAVGSGGQEVLSPVVSRE